MYIFESLRYSNCLGPREELRTKKTISEKLTWHIIDFFLTRDVEK